jgi:kynurenine formamidase
MKASYLNSRIESNLWSIQYVDGMDGTEDLTDWRASTKIPKSVVKLRKRGVFLEHLSTHYSAVDSFKYNFFSVSSVSLANFFFDFVVLYERMNPELH